MCVAKRLLRDTENPTHHMHISMHAASEWEACSECFQSGKTLHMFGHHIHGGKYFLCMCVCVCVGFGFSLNKVGNGLANRCRKLNVLMSEDMNKFTSRRNWDQVSERRMSSNRLGRLAAVTQHHDAL